MKHRRHFSIASLLVFAGVIAAHANVFAGNGSSKDGFSLDWQNRGQSLPLGAFLDIAASGNTVVAVGNVCHTRNLFSCDWFIRAVDAASGTTLWEDRANPSGSFDRSQAVSISGDRVFASGWFAGPIVGFDFAVRAYDLRSGALLWQQRIHRTGTSEFCEGVLAKGNRVFAVGRVRPVGTLSDFTLIAFDAATGEILWERLLNPSGLPLTDIAFGVGEQGNRVFAFGLANNGFAMLTAAFNAQTGETLWTDLVANGFAALPGFEIATHGNSTFVAAEMVTALGDSDFLVIAYDQQTGARKWVQQIDSGGNDFATSVIGVGNRIFVAGGDGCDADFVDCNFATRAFDATTGELLWEDLFRDAPGAGVAPCCLASTGNRVFAGGSSQDSVGSDYKWAIREYRAIDGEVIADDRMTVRSGVNSLTSSGNRVFGAGHVQRAPGFPDTLIRAYR